MKFDEITRVLNINPEKTTKSETYTLLINLEDEDGGDTLKTLRISLKTSLKESQ